MGKKFDAVFESVVSRYQVGGYLPGDIVQFRSNYKSSPTYKDMHSKMKEELDALANGDLNIRVVQVNNRLAGSGGAGNQHKSASDVTLTVAADYGGGRSYGSITVTPDMIDVVDVGNPTPKVPDSMVRKDNVDFKPQEFKPDTKHITRQTDKGDGKNTPTNIKLAGESTKLKNSINDLSMLYEELNS